MMKLAMAMQGNRYNMEKHNIYGQKELMQKLESFQEFDMLCCDEVVSGLFKRDFQKREQINIIKMLNMYRDKYFTIFLVLPNFWDLDVAIRNSMIIKYWIYCFKRGEAVVFTHNDNPGNIDPFNRKMMYGYWKAKKIWKSPYFCGSMQWTDLDPDIYEEYRLIKARKRVPEDLKEDTSSKIKKEVPSLDPQPYFKIENV